MIARLRPQCSDRSPNTKPPAIEPKPYKTPMVPIVSGESLAATARNVGYTSCVPCEKLMKAVMSSIRNRKVGRNATRLFDDAELDTPSLPVCCLLARSSQIGDSGTLIKTKITSKAGSEPKMNNPLHPMA